MDRIARSWTSSTARSNSATSFRGCARRSLTFLRIRRGAMKRITLAFVALTAGSVVGLAQEPPTPPARPVPAPAPRPSEPAPVAPAPRARPAAPVPFRDYDYDLDRDRVREIERQAQEMAREASRI